MRAMLYGLSLITIIASSTVNAQPGSNDCYQAAFTNYLKATLALSQKEVLPSVETEIARRRLEEQFCLNFVQCHFSDRSTQIKAAAFAAMFSSCLNDEALQQMRDSGLAK